MGSWRLPRNGIVVLLWESHTSKFTPGKIEGISDSFVTMHVMY